MRLRIAAAAIAMTLAAALALAPEAGAAPGLAPVGTFSEPTYVTAPPGDPHRLFVVEKGGSIYVVHDGVTRPDPFLNVSDSVVDEGERGMLSMAVAPDYASSGRFYVYFTAPRSGDSGGSVITVEEFRRSAADPDRADPASGKVVLQVDHPTNSNHDGGQLQFGPDGLLYIGTGDGGSGNDPPDNAQNTHVLLGKLLRIDPLRGGGDAYAIPAGNPFADGGAGAREVYSYGLRNPWRFSFDRLNGDLTIGDVGQNTREEIDFAPGGSGVGANYGWHCREGFIATPGVDCPSPPPFVQPVLDYPHSRGCAIVGGYVVRDRDLPSLAGRYVYGDNCDDDIRSLGLANAGGTDAPTGLTVGGLFSFGEDSCGHVYVASGSGTVARIAGDGFTPCPEPVTGPGGGGAAKDTKPPLLGVDRARVQHLSHGRSLYLTAGCDELCGVQVSGSLSIPGAAPVHKLSLVSRTLPANSRVLLRLRLSRKLANAARRVLARGGHVSAHVKVVARDPSSNQSVKTRKVRVRR